ncbi:MAG: V-type ATPase subunit [Candidatus Margulisiibacteriota bacterium]|nr:V-type ATPase subunit [Candidatus Margulisiibacteriota bacterium]
MDKFYYGVARIRALEARLVTPPQLERMAVADDFETAFNILSETPYAETLPKLKHPFDFEELFELEKKALVKLMNKLAPGNEIIQALVEDNYSALKNASSPLIRQMANNKIGLEKVRTSLRKGEKPMPGMEFDFLDLSLPIHLIEKEIDNFIVEKFRKAKYVNSGVEPLVGFYMAKQAEIKTLRFMFICKQNYVKNEQIKERLRVSY